MESDREEFIAQSERRGGQLNKILYWQDINGDRQAIRGTSEVEARQAIHNAKVKQAGRPSQFVTGRFRIIRRHTKVTETEIEI